MFQRILVALDRSKRSCSVLEEALALAKEPAAQLHLVMVVPPMDTGYPDPIYLSMEGMQGVWSTELYQSHLAGWRQQQQEIKDWLRSQADYAHRQGLAAEYSCPEGLAGPTLCEVAAQWHADLIIMGRRGRTGFSELLLGSVSNHVMHHAHCSVLTVQGVEQPAVATAKPQPSAISSSP